MTRELPSLLKRAATPLDQPRAIGGAFVSSKCGAAGSAIDGLRQSGALKLLFPRSRRAVEAVLINTAGGITGGDRFDIQAHAGAGSQLTLTTQAAERAYGAQIGQTGKIRARLRADKDSTLRWLPQETILYQDAALCRRLRADLAPSARFLMVEPVLFGRRAMGEDPTRLQFIDRIDVRRDGKPLYRDGTNLIGNAATLLDRPAIGGGARAMASLLWCAPEAGGKLDVVRNIIGKSGGASMLCADVMVARLLAEDGFMLRRSLLPLLDLLTETSLPQSWRL
ncbi:urease accessory protein UreD [Roseobacter weihaiensis]|uniref:urease accessory protein UreD n=1 Tax=Roseobacter weihaiensis TaxID=2763262 RepID=UPI001D0A70D2|nr:urease accessory protein UreD [Roseobacter sp. H9]